MTFSLVLPGVNLEGGRLYLSSHVGGEADSDADDGENRIETHPRTTRQEERGTPEKEEQEEDRKPGQKVRKTRRQELLT